MKKLDPYLNFNGNTEEVFIFYRSVFGGTFTTLMRFGDMPGSEKMPEADKTKIMHVALPVGQSVLMGTDALDSMNQKVSSGDNIHISISLDEETETRHLFDALSADGQIIMPLGKEDWGQLFGMCRDKYGIQWMINYNDSKKSK